MTDELHKDQSNFFLECTAPLLTDEEPIEDEADERAVIGTITLLNEMAATGEHDITALRNRRAQLLVHLALYRIAKFKSQESKVYRRF